MSPAVVAVSTSGPPTQAETRSPKREEPCLDASLQSVPTSSTVTERQGMSFSPFPHQEYHTDSGAVLRDAIIGFADGLTVPFALTAGLSSIGSSRLVIIGGLAELFAGAISMGLGGYLATITEIKAYESEEAREHREVIEKPQAEEEEIYEIFDKYNLKREMVMPIVEGLKKDPDMWVKFMMDFELKLEKPNAARAWISAITLGLSYFLGGLVPMIPYFAVHNVNKALFASIGITVFILLGFGYVKGIFTGTSQKVAIVSALQTLAVGAAAAGASYGIVRGINSMKSIDVDPTNNP